VLTARQEKERVRQTKRGNKQIMILTYCISIVFLCMAGYFVYFMVTQSQKVINNPYNKRQEVLAKKIRKGDIVSADGKVLAKTETNDEGNDTRIYPYDEMFCHVVGRTENSMTGIESSQCYPLLTSHANPLKQLANTLRGEKSPGDTVITTLDFDLQKAAYEALGNQKGAVVALEPSTGKVLAMVSKPAYNPNRVSEEWEELVSDSNKDSALVNRATQGLYPPGSTFKVLTAMEYLLENPDSYQSFQYSCQGSDTFSGNVINCYGKEVHGTLDVKGALAKSCNGAFAKIGTTLNLTSFRKLVERFGFNKSLAVDFEYNKSRFSLTKDSDTGELTQTVIGQGKTMITPLQNALVAAAIANEGTMMTPYVVDHVENDAGQVVTQYDPKSRGEIVDSSVAKKMNQMMQAVVTEGTGSSLSSLSYAVAGKTGSAEFDSEGTSHAWFIGFAPADNPKIVVSIVVEGAGTGSQYAVPIARRMLETYLGG
jgi:peptidoglycan glycosyltransferase